MRSARQTLDGIACILRPRTLPSMDIARTLLMMIESELGGSGAGA